jgi:hypothetical protein
MYTLSLTSSYKIEIETREPEYNDIRVQKHFNYQWDLKVTVDV